MRVKPEKNHNTIIAKTSSNTYIDYLILIDI